MIQKTRPATSDGASNMRKISTKGSLRVAFVVKEPASPASAFFSFFFPLPVPLLPRPSRGRLFEKTRPRVAQFTKESQCPIAVCNLCQQAQRLLSSRTVRPQFRVVRIHERKTTFFFFSKQPNDLFSQTENF